MADATQPNPTGGSGTNDPITGLYKMSTTAGLGTTEYVAINGAAVTSMILGFASWLANFANVLMIIPLVAVVFGVIGLRQISHSSGTQGGRLIAWGGILLALGFGGWVLGQQVRETVVHRNDEQALVRLIGQFDAAVKAGDVNKAYALFHPDFQRRVNIDQFGTVIKQLSGNQVYGNLEYAKWNEVPFQFEQNGSTRFAAGTVQLKWPQVHEINRAETTFRNDGDEWKILNMPFFSNNK
jgi:hypothetical protein